jgi:hypothetical protein
MHASRLALIAAVLAIPRIISCRGTRAIRERAPIPSSRSYLPRAKRASISLT